MKTSFFFFFSNYIFSFVVFFEYPLDDDSYSINYVTLRWTEPNCFARQMDVNIQMRFSFLFKQQIWLFFSRISLRFFFATGRNYSGNEDNTEIINIILTFALVVRLPFNFKTRQMNIMNCVICYSKSSHEDQAKD